MRASLLVAQCSATPATVAATPPCSATPFHQGGKKNPNPNFLVRIFSSGVVVFHVNGWGPKSSIRPSKHREIKLFGRDIPGFCRDIPGVPEKFEKKKFVFNFRSLTVAATPPCSATPFSKRFRKDFVETFPDSRGGGPGRLFQIFSGLRAQKARETPVNGQQVSKGCGCSAYSASDPPKHLLPPIVDLSCTL